MTSKEWQRLQSVLDTALDLPEPERELYLRRACDGDDSLLESARRLIAAHESDHLIPGRSIRVQSRSLARNDEPVTRIGRYRIERVIGQGGMGVVYMAIQDNPRRTVALKVIRDSSLTEELVRRFEREVEAHGRLQHPGIAQIFEAGTADVGGGHQPYFVLEYVDGQPLLDYCSLRQLRVRDRLELMIQICEAVAHAHQRGVIHRDLKPGNVLVCADGIAKVLDFGVARITGADAVTRHTEAGQLIGTLAYMSPEQVLGSDGRVDERSDIYSLGVMLQELLTGKLPYELRGRQLPEAARMIRDEDPRRLSSTDRSLRGDLESIAFKALEKDPRRRYSTAAEIADDLRRFLENRPVAARPQTTTYQLVKFTRRHKPLVAGVTATFLALAAGLVAATAMSFRAKQAEALALNERDHAMQAEQASKRERDRAIQAEETARAERDRALRAEASANRQKELAEQLRLAAGNEARQANLMLDFLRSDLLSQAGVSSQSAQQSRPDPDLKVRTALDRAAGRVQQRFANDPVLEASMRQTIGTAYRDLGLINEAVAQWERAQALRRAKLGPNHRDTMQTGYSLAISARDRGRYAESEKALRDLVARNSAAFGPEHPGTLTAMRSLAAVFRSQSKYDEAAALQRKVVAIRERVSGKDDPETLGVLNDYAVVLMFQRKYAESGAIHERVHDARRRLLGEEHPATLLSLHNIGMVRYSQERADEAGELLEKVVASQTRVLGPLHPDTLNSVSNLGNVRQNQARHEEAAALYKRAYEGLNQVVGNRSRDTLTSLSNYANALRALRRYEEAEAVYLQSIDLKKAALGPTHGETLRTQLSLCTLYRYMKRFPEAEAQCRETLETRKAQTGPDHPSVLQAAQSLGDLLADGGKLAEAEPVLSDLVQSLTRLKGAERNEALAAKTSLAWCLIRQRQYKRAGVLLEEVRAVRRAGKAPSGRLRSTMRCSARHSPARMRRAKEGR